MPAAVSWRRNLVGLWIAQFTAFFGFSLFFPFIPLFLTQDLHVRSESQVALWAGIAASASGFSMAIFSPIWGAVADRFGRRQMVLRAMIGSGVVMLLMGVVQTPAQLAGTRFLFGITTGTMSATSALIAAETPPVRVGWALGIVASALGMGRAVGPMAGGFMAGFISLRQVFLVAAIMVLVASVPVMILVREGPRPKERRSFRAARELVRGEGVGTAVAITALVVATGLLQFSSMSAQQLVVIRIIGLDPKTAELATGFAFAAVGLATGVAGLAYSWLIPRFGYLKLAIAAAALLCLSEVASAVAPSVPLVVATVAATGLLYGAANPALSSMLGLEAPSEIKATVFGMASSSQALGTAFGPLTGGSVASALGIPAGLYVSAAAAAAISVLLWTKGREPAALGPADADVARLPDREAGGERAPQHHGAARGRAQPGPAGEGHGGGAGGQ